MHITALNIDEFINEIKEPRKTEILQLVTLFSKVTNYKPILWGTIIGFGKLHYTYASGRQGNMPLLGLANRKQDITLYISDDLNHLLENQNLGKYTQGKSCLYIKKLADIDLKVLTKIINIAIKETLSHDYIKVVPVDEN